MKRASMMKTMGLVAIVAAALLGCKKEGAALKPPVHEQKQVVQFSKVPPASLPPVQAMPGGIGNIDFINGAKPADLTKLKASDKLSLDGWSGDPVSGTVPSVIVVQLTAGPASYYTQATRTKLKRPDLVQATQNPAFENSAFQLDADLGSVPPGEYVIGLILSDGKSILGFDTKYKVAVQ